MHCKYCNSTDLVIEWRFEALKPANLAGVQIKYTAERIPYMICNGCGHESKGRYVP